MTAVSFLISCFESEPRRAGVAADRFDLAAGRAGLGLLPTSTLDPISAATDKPASAANSSLSAATATTDSGRLLFDVVRFIG